jgi:hypothetical protein
MKQLVLTAAVVAERWLLQLLQLVARPQLLPKEQGELAGLPRGLLR